MTTRMAFIRAMHSSGRSLNRQIPSGILHGSGEKGPGGSKSPVPENTLAHPSTPHPESEPSFPVEAKEPADIKVSREAPVWSHKGKKIYIRPRRTVAVNRPNGQPEPDTWPPTQEYVDKWAKSEKDRAEPHPLWQFFHVSKGAKDELDAKMTQPPDHHSVEYQPKADSPYENRAWSAAELRLKSFKDLHTLWYVLLKERNVLATQREERRRLGIHESMDHAWMFGRGFKVRKSMARIKAVLQERRLGLLAAVAPNLEPRDRLPHWADATRTHEALWRKTKVVDVRVPRILRRLQAGEFNTRSSPSAVAEDLLSAEVESKDEGFGGGKEAEEFDQHTVVDRDGHVKQV